MQQSGIRTHQSRLVPRNRSSPSTICAAVSAPAVNCDSYEIFDVSSEDDMDLDRELELGFQQLAGDEQCAGVELGDGMDDLERKLQAEMERFEGAGSDNPMNETSTAWHGAADDSKDAMDQSLEVELFGAEEDGDEPAFGFAAYPVPISALNDSIQHAQTLDKSLEAELFGDDDDDDDDMIEVLPLPTRPTAPTNNNSRHETNLVEASNATPRFQLPIFALNSSLPAAPSNDVMSDDKPAQSVGARFVAENAVPTQPLNSERSRRKSLGTTAPTTTTPVSPARGSKKKTKQTARVGQAAAEPSGAATPATTQPKPKRSRKGKGKETASAAMTEAQESQRRVELQKNHYGLDFKKYSWMDTTAVFVPRPAPAATAGSSKAVIAPQPIANTLKRKAEEIRPADDEKLTAMRKEYISRQVKNAGRLGHTRTLPCLYIADAAHACTCPFPPAPADPTQRRQRAFVISVGQRRICTGTAPCAGVAAHQCGTEVRGKIEELQAHLHSAHHFASAAAITEATRATKARLGLASSSRIPKASSPFAEFVCADRWDALASLGCRQKVTEATFAHHLMIHHMNAKHVGCPAEGCTQEVVGKKDLETHMEDCVHVRRVVAKMAETAKRARLDGA
ncbi:unnamed protein product [Mycena citricolor]|uniref:Uncharacterized protein n=1 Tax=Mycena citricolor TaxID=2018698 RepID=A0AAD2HGY2_9AGAR|nr:unnamed protein product [Mycena citricolor]CAK5276479.1 unnamed protein product [Mycena citricolor]